MSTQTEDDIYLNARTVIRFQVIGDGTCASKFPCSHKVEITLEDGRKATACLRKYKIDSTILRISQFP